MAKVLESTHATGETINLFDGTKTGYVHSVFVGTDADPGTVQATVTGEDSSGTSFTLVALVTAATDPVTIAFPRGAGPFKTITTADMGTATLVSVIIDDRP